MAAYRFRFSRRVVLDEIYEIEADSEEEAIDMMTSGEYGDPVETEFIDWYDDDFHFEDKEPIDPLVKMVAEYKDNLVDKLDK